MDFIEKAEIRLKHWISHNDHHQEEYEAFARELKEAGYEESAEYLQEMMEMTAKATEALKKAIGALG